MKDYKYKFRAWDKKELEFLEDWQDSIWVEYEGFDGGDAFEISQFIGLTDENDVEFYIGDIGEFDNGDKFVLKMEWCLQVYVDWIGDPKCEDQAKDLYRIEGAKIIGNIHQNKDLLNDS